ncbi:MAG TPA: DUF3291 domain-containing protein [Rhizomicrobium sp.]|nr:DUF3291 domain-containing protein [Rhizomicrobium sp.]
MQLAQLNIGKFRAGRDDPRMADFFNNLDRINAAAERMPGFVWRLKDDSGNATNIAWPGEPDMAVNLTVWQSVEALEKFVFQTAHRAIYARKHEFFEPPAQPVFVMWFVPDSQLPTVEEARERLEHYRAHGGSEHAFGWADVPSAKLWQEKRCA